MGDSELFPIPNPDVMISPGSPFGITATSPQIMSNSRMMQPRQHVLYNHLSQQSLQLKLVLKLPDLSRNFNTPTKRSLKTRSPKVPRKRYKTMSRNPNATSSQRGNRGLKAASPK